jgi:hypothetical protein
MADVRRMRPGGRTARTRVLDEELTVAAADLAAAVTATAARAGVFARDGRQPG